jgi:hypothetical protein
MTLSTLATQVTPPGSAEDRSQEFVAVEGGAEATSAEALVVAAYGIMWVLLLGFMWLTWRRQREIDDKVTRLASQVERAAERDPRRP